MEHEQVVSILESLGNGIDPISGAAFTHDVLQSPDVVRALVTAAATLRQVRGPRPAAAGARWTEDEDALLCHEFDDAVPIADIAKSHGRSRAAITLRLIKLGRLDADTAKVRERTRVA